MVISLPPPPKANAEAEAKAKAEAEAKAARGTILESRLLPCHSVDFGKGGRTPAPPPPVRRRAEGGRGEGSGLLRGRIRPLCSLIGPSEPPSRGSLGAGRLKPFGATSVAPGRFWDAQSVATPLHPSPAPPSVKIPFPGKIGLSPGNRDIPR